MRKTYVMRDGKLVPKTQIEGHRLHILPDIQPYQAAGPEYGKWITSRSQHREYLRKHNLIEVGNERRYFGI